MSISGEIFNEAQQQGVLIHRVTKHDDRHAFEFWIEKKPIALIDSYNSGEIVVLVTDGEIDNIYEFTKNDIPAAVNLVKSSLIK